MQRIKIGWFIQDLAAHTKQANSEFRRMLAGPIDPGPIFSISDMESDIHPDDRDKIYGRLAHTAVTGEPLREHFRLRDATGDERLILEHASIIERGGQRLRMGMLIDISPDDIAQIRSGVNSELDKLAASLLAARNLASVTDNAVVKNLIDMALMEVGGQIALLSRTHLPDWH